MLFLCDYVFVKGNFSFVNSQLFECFLRGPEFVQYLRRSCQVKHTHLTKHQFLAFDNLFQYHVISMARITPKVRNTGNIIMKYENLYPFVSTEIGLCHY